MTPHFMRLMMLSLLMLLSAFGCSRTESASQSGLRAVQTSEASAESLEQLLAKERFTAHEQLILEKAATDTRLSLGQRRRAQFDLVKARSYKGMPLVRFAAETKSAAWFDESTLQQIAGLGVIPVDPYKGRTVMLLDFRPTKAADRPVVYLVIDKRLTVSEVAAYLQGLSTSANATVTDIGFFDETWRVD